MRSNEKNAGFSYREVIAENPRGLTVLQWLGTRYTHSNEETWRERIELGEVLLDGRPPPSSERLRQGQELVWNRPPWIEPEVPLDFEVIHVDPFLLAVAKPSGLPTMPAGGFLENTLLARVREEFPNAVGLHRLGRGTSGLVLFARDAQARKVLSASFRKREIRRVYRGLAQGDPPWDARTLDVPIGRVPHPLLGEIFAASEDGREARSQVRVVRRFGELSLLEIELETGRPHQIRIHLAAAGHPLVGDPLYLDGGLAKEDAVPGDPGYLLHAWRLEFIHPRHGTPLALEAPLPPDLRG